MHKLYDVKEKLIREMEEYANKSNLSKDDVMSIKYLSSSIDHICNILEKADEEEYSNAMGNSYEMPYTRGGRGNSYARGGNVRRDSMGRYSRERGYSRDDDFKSELQELIQDAPNEHIRQKMQMIMSEM